VFSMRWRSYGALGSGSARGPKEPRQAAPRSRRSGQRKALQSALAAELRGEREPRTKSLTLRLSEGQYERLRRFAFERRLSHQDIIERGLVEYLDQQERA
jgi:hypothetical protein